MITAQDRFKQICRFERRNDPSFFGIFAWVETYHRWVREGMPVDNLDNMKREEYKDLIMIGNVDKRELAKGKEAIDSEVARIRTLLKHGGYFPGCDHHFPPDVSYENLVYFLNEVRKLSDFEETQREIEIPSGARS